MAFRSGTSELSTMSSDPIDQALFGYADGHRQIASSVRLPPKDLYLLSSASDLASGARLSDDESYLTGLPLPESRKYALFRTWPAPEMPRPGCVWSHTILLDSRTVALISSFSELLSVFRRPVGRETLHYDEPLDLAPSPSAEPTHIGLILPIIDGYYSGRSVTLSSEESPNEIERSILAVWSQQWPRQRMVFSFCTANLNERRRSESSEYDVQVAASNEVAPLQWQSWVTFGAMDAAQNKVTPLRRFLWRYGRDLSASRRHYKMLVDLFEQTADADQIPADLASTIFQSLPEPSDGAVLKRDVLGIGPSSPRLIAPISVVHFLQLLTSESLPETPTPAQVERRLGELTSQEIGRVARYYAAHKEELSSWKPLILNAIVLLADKSTITSEYPSEILVDLLVAREDLIDSETLRPLKNDDLARLLREDAPSRVIDSVIMEMLGRDMGEAQDRAISVWPTTAFRLAVEAFVASRLNNSWLSSFASHGANILAGPWLDLLHSTSQLAATFAMLRYPRTLAKTSGELALCLSGLNDDVQGIERSNMQAVLLRAAIDEGSAQSWRLVLIVLPELRAVILQGGLPNIAQKILTDDLPSFYSAGYWDLNKRILLSLSKLFRVAPDEYVLNRLSLSPLELQMVVYGEEYSTRHALSAFLELFLGRSGSS